MKFTIKNFDTTVCCKKSENSNMKCHIAPNFPPRPRLKIFVSQKVKILVDFMEQSYAQKFNFSHLIRFQMFGFFPQMLFWQMNELMQELTHKNQ